MNGVDTHSDPLQDHFLQAVDYQNAELVQTMCKEHPLSRLCLNQSLRIAAAHENTSIIPILMTANANKPELPILNELFTNAVVEGVQPELICCLQEYVHPAIVAEYQRARQGARGNSNLPSRDYYVVDLSELDSICKFEKNCQSIESVSKAGSATRRNYIKDTLKNQAWINDLLIMATISDYRLLLNRILQLSGSLKPSQSTINSAFHRALYKDSHTVAYLLAARGDHAMATRNQWSCIDQNGYNEAFQLAVDMNDSLSISFLLDGKTGFRPPQQLIDAFCQDIELQSYEIKLNSKFESKLLHSEELEREGDTRALLILHSSAECQQSIYEQQKSMRNREDQRHRRARVFRGIQTSADIHAYSGVAVHAPGAPVDNTAMVAPTIRRRNGPGSEHTLNNVVLEHIERRIENTAGYRNTNYTLNDMANEMTTLIMQTFPSESEQDSAVRIISDILNESTLDTFQSTLIFLRMLEGREGKEGMLVNIWMEGFLSESISVHSCNPGAVERIVTGLRGIGDSELDVIFGQAEGPHLARAFLKGSMNIFYSECDEVGKKRAISNAKTIAQALVENFNVCIDTSEAKILECIKIYMSNMVSSYGVNISNYEDDISVIAEIITDNYETHMIGHVRKLLYPSVVTLDNQNN